MPAILYALLTWTTERREPLISATIAVFLRRFLPSQARRFDVEVLEIGIVRDHVHVLLRLPPACPIPQLVQALKGASARVANRDGMAPREHRLRWARGYHLCSVSPRALPATSDYVRRQPQRHPLDRVGEPAEDS